VRPMEEFKNILVNHFIYGQRHIIFHIFLIFLNLWISVFLLIINEGYLLYTSCALRLHLSKLLMKYIYL